MDPMGVSAYFFSTVPKQQTICPDFFVEKSNIRNFQQKLTRKKVLTISSSFFWKKTSAGKGLQLTEELDQASNVEDGSTWVPTGISAIRCWVSSWQKAGDNFDFFPPPKKLGKEIGDKNRSGQIL